MAERVLVVDDEPSLQLTLADALSDEGFEVSVAGTVAEAVARLDEFRPDLVLCDLRLPDGDGLDVLREAHRTRPDLPFVILTAYGAVETAVAAIKAGADDFLTKPFEDAQLLAAVDRHLEVVRLRRRVAALEDGPDRPVGVSPAFVAALELAKSAAATDASILILGETGTGKEVVARFVHQSSPRRQSPFVAVNCAALPETLLEAELFGHEKGAFTGAVRQRRGRFEEADGGTVFLDEVGEMPPSSQAKLLRVVQEGTFERLGSNRTLKTDARIIAATRRDLGHEVDEGRFRDDLYYRLRVIPIELPPLRERPEDIPVLAALFAKRYGAKLDRRLVFAPETLRCLAGHPFPGNVRELENLVHRIAVLVPADLVEPHHLPGDLAPRCRALLDAPDLTFEGTLAEMSTAFEREVLEQTLTRHDGHRGRMSEALGISRKSLWQKLKAHGLDK